MAKKSKTTAQPKADRSPAQRGKSSRTKGVRGERQVVAFFKRLWPDTDRNVQYRGAARDGPDVFSEAAKLDGEVKHRQHTSIQLAIKEAMQNCRLGRTWFAVDWPTTGPRRGSPTITFDLGQFIELIERERKEAEAFGYDAGYDDGKASK